MRQELARALLAGALALALAIATSPRGPIACDQPRGMNGNYVKPSSLVPGERAYKNQYGAPIPKPIVSRHVPRKVKPQPQLHSAPLPPA